MASLWQKRANARNASKSTGPKTLEGKAIAAQNAIKHGYTALKIDEQTGDAVFEAKRKSWADTFGPTNDVARELVDASFILLQRVKRLGQAEEAAGLESYLCSSERFDLERREAVDGAMADLVEKPFPSFVLLFSMVQGCERLRTLLEEIEEALDDNRWTDECLLKLRAARGLGAESRDVDLKAASDFVIEHQGKTCRADEQELIDLFNEAVIWIRETIVAQREDLERRIVALADEEERARKLFIAKSKVDTSPAGKLLMRALTQATNAFTRTFEAAKQATGLDLSKLAEPKPAPAPAPRPVPAPAPKPESRATPPLRNEPKSRIDDRAGREDGVEFLDLSICGMPASGGVATARR